MDRKGKLTPLGYVIAIVGLLLAAISYFLLGVDRFFLGLDGTLGLNETFWLFIGGIIWIFVIMGIVSGVVLKFCFEKIEKN